MSDPNGPSLGKPHILSDTLKRLLATSNNEQAELQELNERFANYIEKIRSLEKQNQSLEGELRKLQGSESKRFADTYNEEIEMLRKKLKTQDHYSSRLEIQLEGLRVSLEKVTGEKEEAEKKLAALKEDMDAPTLASKVLVKEVEALQEEIAFQKKLHEEEILELKDQLQEKKGIVQFDGGKSDLTAALRDLREQFQNISTANVAETDEWYKSKMSEMNDTVNKNNEALKKVRQENNEFRHQIQNNICEISSLKGTNEALKNQIKELEECHTGEVASLQDTITTLEEETKKMENDMVSLLHEYQDLLKVKVSLDVEIATYRKLLEGEESRIEPPGPSSDTSDEVEDSD